MVYPTYEGTVQAAGASSGTSLVVNKPYAAVNGVTIKDGDYLIARLRSQGLVSGTVSWACSGWTALSINGSNDRSSNILYKKITSAASEPADGSGYTFSSNGASGRMAGSIRVVRHASQSSFLGGSKAYTAMTNGTTTTPSASGWTIDSATDKFLIELMVSDERTSGQSATPVSGPSGYTLGDVVQNTLDASTTGSRTMHFTYWDESIGVTSTGTQTFTFGAAGTSPKMHGIAMRGMAEGSASGGYAWTGVAVGHTPDDPPSDVPAGYGVGGYDFSATSVTGKRKPKATIAAGYDFNGTAVGRRPISPGFTDVNHLMRTPGATIAHRGGSQNYPEMSDYAYEKSAGLGFGALEFSIGWTSDLVPFGCADQYLDRMAGLTAGTNLSPTSITWATLSSTYVNKLNPVSPGVFQPFYKLEDFLQKYSGTHVLCVDPKYGFATQTKIDIMLDLCDLYGGPTKIILKFDSPETDGKLTTSAHARGYTCMNYWGTDTTSMAAQQSRWDYIGARFDDSAAMTQANTYGKPVWGAVANGQTQYNTAIANGADVVMCSNVLTTTPIGRNAQIAYGSASSTYNFAGLAVAKRSPKGSASATFAFNASPISGKRRARSEITATYDFSGTSILGKRYAKGSCLATYAFNNTLLVGTAPVVGGRSGYATGTYLFAGAVSGRRRPKASLAAGYAFAGAAVGRQPIGTSFFVGDFPAELRLGDLLITDVVRGDG